MPNIRKKQILMYLLKNYITYSLSRNFGCKKALFYVIKGLFQFKRKIPVIDLREFNNLSSQFFSVHQVS